MIYFILLIVVILEAVEDGLWEKSHKKWSKRVEALYKIILLVMVAFYPFSIQQTTDWTSRWMVFKMMFEIGLLWASIRAYMFDPIMHLISGFETDHPGVTSPIWDNIMKRLPGWKTWVWRAFWLGFSIFWYLIAVR